MKTSRKGNTPYFRFARKHRDEIIEEQNPPLWKARKRKDETRRRGCKKHGNPRGEKTKREMKGDTENDSNKSNRKEGKMKGGKHGEHSRW